MTIVLRFIFGAILAAAVLVFGGLPFVINIILILSVGLIAAIWGDKFILGFMSLMRYFR
jgi:hypothetical protein